MAFKNKLYCHTLGCKMGFAVKGIKRLISQRFSDHDIKLTIEQYIILNILDNEEGLILQELAELLDRDKSAVLRHINCLENNHFVARTTDSQDKRRKLLLVTKRGLNELEQARNIDKKVNQQFTEQFSQEELQNLDRLLSEIYQQSFPDEDS